MVNPLLEQRALAEGRALALFDDRSVIAIDGPDRLKWLHSILSQALLGLKAGDSVEALQLDAQGRIEFALHIYEDGNRTWLIVERATKEALLAWLDRMIFRSDVTITDLDDSFSVYFGVNTDFGITWVDPWPGVVAGGVRYAAEGHSFGGREHILESAPELPLVNKDAAEALRIMARRPRQLTEVDEKSIPHEYDWLATAVHLSKGCYRGQETVAKVHNVGHPPRRLAFLHLDGSNHLLPEEVDVTLDGEIVGRVTSIAQHFEAGPIALAILKRSISETAELSVGRTTATQEVIVPQSAGKAANLPDRNLLMRRK